MHIVVVAEMQLLQDGDADPKGERSGPGGKIYLLLCPSPFRIQSHLCFELLPVASPKKTSSRTTKPNFTQVKMRQKRAKAYRKLMSLYSMSFGFRQPYQVLGAFYNPHPSIGLTNMLGRLHSGLAYV